MAGARTRGFLFADLRGYTDYLEAHGDHAGAALLAEYRALVRAAVAGADGAEVRTEGDSFYVVFDSASAAVRCGVAILSAAASAEPPVRVGIGIHAGETVETDEGLVGSAVNIAARVCAQARPGELLVTDTVRALTRTFLDVGFVPIGARTLKGIPEAVNLYRVVPERSAGIKAPRVPRAGVRPGVPLLAAGIALTVVVSGLVAGAWYFGRAGTPTPTPAPTATPPEPTATPVPPTAQPSPATSRPDSTSSQPSRAPTAAAYPTPAETVLLARLPAPIRTAGTCRRAAVADQTATATVSLACDLPPGSGASTVWFEQLDPSTAVLDAYNARIVSHAVSHGDCASQPKAWQEWQVNAIFSGHLVCYGEAGGSWVVWTYEANGIIARATRQDANATALYAWWRGVAPFLRP